MMNFLLRLVRCMRLVRRSVNADTERVSDERVVIYLGVYFVPELLPDVGALLLIWNISGK